MTIFSMSNDGKSSIKDCNASDFHPSGNELETNRASRVLALDILSLRIGSTEDSADDDPPKLSKQVI